MTDTIKKGTVLWAIAPCAHIRIDRTLEKPRLTVGTSYEVKEIVQAMVFIVNDLGVSHGFSLNDLGRYFSLTPPEDKGVQTEGKSEDSLSDFTIPEFTDAHYIRLYDAIGPKYFCKGSDDQLRVWGNSEDDIMKIKIDCVKNTLQFHKNGIVFYLMLCEIRG